MAPKPYFIKNVGSTEPPSKKATLCFRSKNDDKVHNIHITSLCWDGKIIKKNKSLYTCTSVLLPKTDWVGGKKGMSRFYTLKDQLLLYLTEFVIEPI